MAPTTTASASTAKVRLPEASKQDGLSTNRLVSPDALSWRNRMTVDKKIVDELLLVCGVIGTTVTTASTASPMRSSMSSSSKQRLIPVTDCLNWLQDLQRALRRDDDSFRPISLLLGQWKVVPQKLLPLVISCRYDTAIVSTVCKILVILTKPLAENTKRAGRMVIETKKTDKR